MVLSKYAQDSCFGERHGKTWYVVMQGPTKLSLGRNLKQIKTFKMGISKRTILAQEHTVEKSHNSLQKTPRQSFTLEESTTEF